MVFKNKRIVMADSVVIEDNVVYSTIPEYVYPNDNMVKFLFTKLNQWPDREIMVMVLSKLITFE